jgi:hypothetical protein
MSVFGYNHPAGAEHDLSAPWNQPDDGEKPRAELRGSSSAVLRGSSRSGVVLYECDSFGEKISAQNPQH